MFVNNKNISLFKAEVTDDYSIGPASIDSRYTLGGGSSTPIGYGLKIGARQLVLPIAFVCEDTKEAYIKRSLLLQEFEKETVLLYDEELNLYFSVVLISIKEEELLFDGVLVTTFVFEGVMHGKMITKVQEGPFIPDGVSSEGQDCRLKVVVSSLEDDGSFKIGRITFDTEKVSVGSKIEIDGFSKIVYVNDGPSIGSSDIVSFPKLYPGVPNFFECKDKVTIEYFPVYK